MQHETEQQHQQHRPAPIYLGRGKKCKPMLPLVFLQRRLLLILVLGGLIAMTLSLLIPRRIRPTYETDVLLLLDPTREPTVTGRERDMIPGNIADYTRTLVERLYHVDVMTEALQRIPVEHYPSFLRRDDEDIYNAFRLMSRVRARDVGRTYLISANIYDSAPDHLALTLNTLMEVFIERIQAERERLYERRINYLQEERERLEKRIATKRDQLVAMASSINSAGFLHADYTVHLSKLTHIERIYWQAEASRIEKRGLLYKARTDQEELAAIDLQPYADEHVANSWALNQIEHWTYGQLQQMRGTIDGLTEENEDRRYVEERMVAMMDYLETYRKRVFSNTVRIFQEKREVDLATDLVRAESDYAAAARTAEALRSELDAARREASAVSEAIFEGSDIAFTIAQLRERLANINNRIDDSEVEAKAPIRISLDKRATDPDRPARTTQNKATLFAAIAGFGSIFVLVLAYDLLDNRVRTPREIELALGTSERAGSHVPALLLKPSFERATLDAPAHPATKAVRALAARVNLERETTGGRLFALAGINDHCGATSVAINLAHAMATLCDKVLLIETNMRRANMRAALELPPAPGVESVMQGEADWQDLVREDPQRRLAVLPAEGSGRPASCRALTHMLEEAAQRYDIVIVDVGNVCDDDLSYHAAIHADALLLVARADVSLYRDLRQVLDRMIQARVPALSAVLTFASPLFASLFLDRLQQSLLILSRMHGKVLRVLHPFRRRTG